MILAWETLTKAAFDRVDRARAAVLVTCSPIEVHGPHLPLGADAFEGEGLAERMLRFLPERHRDRAFLKLPFIYAVTDTVPHPGSLSFRPATTMAVLEDLGRSLAAQGLKDIVVSNFHGSPRHFLAIERACERVNRRSGARMIPLFSVMLSRLTEGGRSIDDALATIPGVAREDLRGDIHAGFIETAQLLALRGAAAVEPGYRDLPRLTIDSWLAAQGQPPAQLGAGRRASARVFLRAIRASARFFRAETYSGSPAAATAELGEKVLDAFASRAAEAWVEVLDGKLSPFACHSPLWRWRFFFLNPLLIRLANWYFGIM